MSHSLVFRASAYTVEPGHRAFKFNKISGVQEEIYREGWHLKLPYFEKPIIYDVRSHPKVIKSVTGSKGMAISCTLRIKVGFRLLLSP